MGNRKAILTAWQLMPEAYAFRVPINPDNSRFFYPFYFKQLNVCAGSSPGVLDWRVGLQLGENTPTGLILGNITH
jgi:hypothetical protein